MENRKQQYWSDYALDGEQETTALCPGRVGGTRPGLSSSCHSCTCSAFLDLMALRRKRLPVDSTHLWPSVFWPCRRYTFDWLSFVMPKVHFWLIVFGHAKGTLLTECFSPCQRYTFDWLSLAMPKEHFWLIVVRHAEGTLLTDCLSPCRRYIFWLIVFGHAEGTNHNQRLWCIQTMQDSLVWCVFLLSEPAGLCLCSWTRFLFHSFRHLCWFINVLLLLLSFTFICACISWHVSWEFYCWQHAPSGYKVPIVKYYVCLCMHLVFSHSHVHTFEKEKKEAVSATLLVYGLVFGKVTIL